MTKIMEQMDFSVKITRKKKVLHVFLALLVKNHVFLHLTLTMNHPNSAKNSLFIQNDTKKRLTLHKKELLHFFLFFFPKIINFLHFDLGIDLTTLKMTLNPQNNTINKFSSQNHTRKRYYTCS